MRNAAIACMLLLVGCPPPEPEPPSHYVTHRKAMPPEMRERYARFVVECATAANPRSDEEGEDLVQQCEDTGFRVLGEQRKLCIRRQDGRSWACSTVSAGPCKALCSEEP